ncbi:MAG: methanogenesis marker 3 protein [Euryarchaeota archaeon]|nr:methanogenesis marker 3 protein [Euryarchaeota archaeon]
MKITVNGNPRDVGIGATVSDVLKGEPHHPGSAVALIRSSEDIKKETSEFEVVTTRGSFVIRVLVERWQTFWREIYQSLVDRTVRWQTSKVTAIGSFPSSAVPSREPSKFIKYDCFIALGGYDNRTTYIMVARQDHSASYGVEAPVFGRITRGRHVLDTLQETDRIVSVTPVILEYSSKDAFATTDYGTKLEEGMTVETYVSVKLDPGSPVSVEHFLVALEKGEGTIKVTDKTEAYTASSVRMDVNLIDETHAIRERNAVTVRSTGPGMGRIYFYQSKRQIVSSHNMIGMITNGFNLIHLVPMDGVVTVIPDPMRVMVVGMTQKEGGEYLRARGLSQKRTGQDGDDMIIVEQEPELTLHTLEDKEVYTLGVDPKRVTVWYMFRDRSPNTIRYIEKITGLDNKPIGTVKVHFTYEGMPMVTFEGNDDLGASLFPEVSFEKICRKGDIGVTNMSRPNRGIIGIRLEDSDEFGPTGEEEHGTNILGRFVSDIPTMMDGLKDGHIVYVRETNVNPDGKRAVKRSANAAPKGSRSKPAKKAPKKEASK